jgi:hypothetical protein
MVAEKVPHLAYILPHATRRSGMTALRITLRGMRSGGPFFTGRVCIDLSNWAATCIAI